MGSADHYADGEWNFYCDLCGRKGKSSKGVKTWDNHWVCLHHKEARNPQDFIKGVKDNQSLPWTRPTVLTFVSLGGNAILDTTGDFIAATDHTPILDTGV